MAEMGNFSVVVVDDDDGDDGGGEQRRQLTGSRCSACWVGEGEQGKIKKGQHKAEKRSAR
jgi:hypothetical protein